ncbi:MAG: hypothetical protein N2C12_14620 [Planctomycetales bacterium]
MSRSNIIPMLLACLLFVNVLGAEEDVKEPAAEPEPKTTTIAEPGEAAPDFTLQSPDGKKT